MRYDLSTRKNSDAPQPAAGHKDSGLAAETHADDETATTITRPEHRLDDQVTEQKSAGEAANGETPAGDSKAAEYTAIEQLPHEYEYQERLPNNVTMQPVTTIWPENTLIEMRARWQAVQLRFVDDPAAVTGEIQALVSAAVQAIPALLADRQRELDTSSRSGGHDTEQLRIAVQRYRDFYELLLGY